MLVLNSFTHSSKRYSRKEAFNTKSSKKQHWFEHFNPNGPIQVAKKLNDHFSCSLFGFSKRCQNTGFCFFVGTLYVPAQYVLCFLNEYKLSFSQKIIKK